MGLELVTHHQGDQWFWKLSHSNDTGYTVIAEGFGKSWNDCRYSAIFKLKAISDDFRGVLEKLEGQDEVHDP